MAGYLRKAIGGAASLFSPRRRRSSSGPKNRTRRGIIAQIHYTRVISAAFINNFSVAATRLWIPIYSTTAESKYPQAADLKGLPPRGHAPDAFPTINFSGNNSPSNWGGGPFDHAQNNYVLQDNLQWVRGKHVLSFGFQMQFMQTNDARPSSGTGASFSFSNVPTAGFAANGP